jgi:protein-L-isoaspartate(D-aspartate) O-methyltransferase
MVRRLIASRGITNEAVLRTMNSVPRHLFVPERLQRQAYEDHPLPIGGGQTISQPYVVALMSEVISPDRTMKVLETGTGSGYQAAVLSRFCRKVYSTEIVDELGHRAEKTLTNLGYSNVSVKTGDGYKGWKEHTPYDAVIVTCAPGKVPQPLITQLAEGGRMVIPVGESGLQKLVLLAKSNG